MCLHIFWKWEWIHNILQGNKNKRPNLAITLIWYHLGFLYAFIMCSGGVNGVFIAYTHTYVCALPPSDNSCATTSHTFLCMCLCVCVPSVFSWTTRQYSQRWLLSRCLQPICCRSIQAWSLMWSPMASWWTLLSMLWRNLPSWWEGWTSQVQIVYFAIN